MSEVTKRRYCSVPEAAEHLEITPGTIYREIERGNLQAKRFGKKNIKIALSELKRYESESNYEAGQYRVSPMKDKPRPDLRSKS